MMPFEQWIFAFNLMLEYETKNWDITVGVAVTMHVFQVGKH